MAAAYLSLGKLVGPGIVLKAARHNLREIQSEIGADSHIDASRIYLNQLKAGPATATEVAALAQELMNDAGITKLRKDAVRAVEILVTLPSSQRIDSTQFFADALAWQQKSLGVPILSAVIHLDESAPHMHTLLLPLVEGRMVGSDFVGNRQRLCSLQSDFFSKVCAHHGLSRPRTPKRLSRLTCKEAA